MGYDRQEGTDLRLRFQLEMKAEQLKAIIYSPIVKMVQFIMHWELFLNFEIFQPRLNGQQSHKIRCSLLLHDFSGWFETVSMTNSMILTALPFSSSKIFFPLGSPSRFREDGIFARPASRMKSFNWWYASNHIHHCRWKPYDRLLYWDWWHYWWYGTHRPN